jgi:hypothetical protein
VLLDGLLGKVLLFWCEILTRVRHRLCRVPSVLYGIIPFLNPFTGIGGLGILGFQHGGLVNRPTLAMLGEAGPELITPLTGPGAGRGGTTIIQVNIGDQTVREIVLETLGDEVKLRQPSLGPG